MAKDCKISVVVITPHGLDFRGIYSNENDALNIALLNADKGDVAIVKFDQTLSRYSDIKRGIYMSNPKIYMLPFQAQGLIQ